MGGWQAAHGGSGHFFGNATSNEKTDQGIYNREKQIRDVLLKRAEDMTDSTLVGSPHPTQSIICHVVSAISPRQSQENHRDGQVNGGGEGRGSARGEGGGAAT